MNLSNLKRRLEAIDTTPSNPTMADLEAMTDQQILSKFGGDMAAAFEKATGELHPDSMTFTNSQLEKIAAG